MRMSLKTLINSINAHVRDLSIEPSVPVVSTAPPESAKETETLTKTIDDHVEDPSIEPSMPVVPPAPEKAAKDTETLTKTVDDHVEDPPIEPSMPVISPASAELAKAGGKRALEVLQIMAQRFKAEEGLPSLPYIPSNIADEHHDARMGYLFDAIHDAGQLLETILRNPDEITKGQLNATLYKAAHSFWDWYQKSPAEAKTHHSLLSKQGNGDVLNPLKLNFVDNQLIAENTDHEMLSLFETGRESGNPEVHVGPVQVSQSMADLLYNMGVLEVIGGLLAGVHGQGILTTLHQIHANAIR
jgi:hypothetical protein